MLIHRQTTTEQMRIRSDVRSLQHVSFLLVVSHDCTGLSLHAILCCALSRHALLTCTVHKLALHHSQITPQMRGPVSPVVPSKDETLTHHAYPRLGHIWDQLSLLLLVVNRVG